MKNIALAFLYATLTLGSPLLAADNATTQTAFSPPTDPALDRAREIADLKHYEQAIPQVENDLHAVVEKCNTAFSTSHEIKTYVSLAECYNKPIAEIYRRANYPYMDLIQAFNDKRLSIGRSIDSQAISASEGEIELSASYAQIKQEEKERDRQLMPFFVASSVN